MVHQGYFCKFCELFCGHSSSSQEVVTVNINNINLGTYSMITILLLNLQTNKCIPLPNFSQFTSFTANFPNDKGPGPQIQISWKITGIKGGNTQDVLYFLI